MQSSSRYQRSGWRVLLVALAVTGLLPTVAVAGDVAQGAPSLIAFHADPDGQDDLFVIKPDGSGLRRLTTGLEEVATPHWSPNGTRIAFLARPEGIEDVFVVDASGRNRRRLTREAGDSHDFAWSPDGRRIAFACCGESALNVYVMNADGSKRALLVEDAAQPSWSPDGQRIAFISFRDGNAEIYSVSLDDTALTRLTSNPAEDVDPSWSPRGNQIAFTSKRRGKAQIYVMAADGSDQRRLVADRWYDETPSWSPNGQRIVFPSYRNRDPLLRGIGNAEIVVAAAGGGSVKNLTRTRFWEGDPEWSPDGRQIAFAVRRDFGPNGTFRLEVMKADGSRRRALPPVRGSNRAPANSCCPAWRP